jgi:hypothetical protein
VVLGSSKPKKLLDQLRDSIRIKHYSYSTEKSYVHWAKRHILFYNKRHPAEIGAQEIEAFLSRLAQEGNVSASTQNQAFNVLLFLYRNVLHLELKAPIHALRAKQSQHLPTVLSKNSKRPPFLEGALNFLISRSQWLSTGLNL